MTLQLEVGKWYKRRDGQVVQIVARSKDPEDVFSFKGSDDDWYKADGGWSCGILKTTPFDLIEEITDQFARVLSALNDAERAEAEAMARIRDSLAELRAALEAAQKEMRGEG